MLLLRSEDIAGSPSTAMEGLVVLTPVAFGRLGGGRKTVHNR
jgi:hypothetical protein